MGSKGPASVEVTWSDQQDINTFGKLNTRQHELEAQIKAKQRLLEDLDDASNELMLVDDEAVRYQIGECFMHMDQAAAEERVEAATQDAKASTAELQKQLDELRERMAVLKRSLYSKFGTNINLEE